MANKVEILVEVDPLGRGAAAIKNVQVNLDSLGKKAKETGQSGKDALSDIAGAIGIPLSIGAASALAIKVASDAKDAALDQANAYRILKSDAQGVGISFEEASKHSEKFGEQLAVSNTQAANSFSRFLRVVGAAGELKNLDRYQQAFADLAAAYGLQASEVENLTQQLLSGQDEALNRLGIADPSQLYVKYAAQVGKTVEELTNEEKVRARLLAVIEKGEKFQGAANERLTSEVGIWANLSKSIADATANLGKYITKKGGLPNDIATGLTGLINGEGATGALQKRLEAEYAAQAAAANREANANVDNFLREHGGLPPDLSKDREKFVKQYDDLFKDGKLDAATAAFAERQLAEIKNILDPGKYKEYSEKFTKFWENYSKTATNALKSARDAADKLLGRTAEISGGEGNPFVKVLIDSETRAKSLRETFKTLTADAIKGMLALEEAYTRQKLLGLELDQTLKANALRRQADALEKPTGLSGRENRGLDRLEAEIKAGENIPKFLAIADAIANRRTRIDPNSGDKPTRELAINADKIFKSQYDLINAISTRGLGNAGDLAKERVAGSLVNLFEGLDPAKQAAIARGEVKGIDPRIFADAFKEQAASFTRSIQDAIDKGRVADRAVEGARQDLRDIEAARAKGLDSREADKRLLSVTGELSPNELTADLRQARIEALRREADREAKAKDEANKSIDKARESTDALKLAVDNLTTAIKSPENRKLLVEINNRATATAEVVGGF